MADYNRQSAQHSCVKHQSYISTSNVDTPRNFTIHNTVCIHMVGCDAVVSVSYLSLPLKGSEASGCQPPPNALDACLASTELAQDLRFPSGFTSGFTFPTRIYTRIYVSHQDSQHDVCFPPGFTSGFTFSARIYSRIYVPHQDLQHDLRFPIGFTSTFTFSTRIYSRIHVSHKDLQQDLRFRIYKHHQD